jgi:hypothetical protein
MTPTHSAAAGLGEFSMQQPSPYRRRPVRCHAEQLEASTSRLLVVRLLDQVDITDLNEESIRAVIEYLLRLGRCM